MNRFRRFLSALGGSLSSDPDVADYQPTKRKDMSSVYGAVGTLNFAGYLTDLDEYNDLFMVNQTAMKTFNQMRFGDPRVFSLLTALGLPIESARWDVTPPDSDVKPLEKEAADLIRQNLFGGLEYTSPSGATVSQSWGEVLKHALLMLPFGSSCAEEIYAIDGPTVRLARFAPRMPQTYWRWHVDDDGETLLMLEQIAYRGSNLQFWKIPADKLTIFTFQREGAYFAGRSMLRPVYSPWFYLTQLQNIEAIAAERNGMGIPVLKHAPNASAEDRKLGNQWVTQIAANESVGLGLPNGSDFKLVGVEGRTFDVAASVKRHGQEITRAGLASFLDLGTTETGARSVGDTLSNFFYLAEQTLADQICWGFMTGPIRRLTDLNYPGKFGRGKLRYPKLTASNVQSRSIVAVIEYLDKVVSSGVVRPDDALESKVRQDLGFPAYDPKTGRLAGQAKVTERVDTAGPAAAPAHTPGASQPAAAPSQAAALQQQVSADAKQMSAAYTPWRQPRGPETHIALSDVVDHLDGGKTAIASALRRAKKPMLAALGKKLASAAPGAAHQVSLAPDHELAAEVKAHLDGVYRFGRATVQHEQASQRAGHQPGQPQTEKVTASAVMLDAGAGDQVSLLADTTVSQFQNSLGARAAAAAIAAKRKNQPVTPAVDAVSDDPDGWVDRTAGEGVNGAMANGRQDGFDAVRDQIDHFVYSALLDANTCGDCGDADGKEGGEGDIPAVPNPNCQGGDQCRCMWVAVFKDEGGAA